ncbi:Uncharacterised protein [Streptococcus agalactiae]|uniref:Uncharacterized protein n=1 Tax=Streptococcus agalactiae TaxID=1311 RepID=A0AB38VNP9_STRAG|nr:Uncharacterised protein [Streptococcus agalactiae]VED65226.1 Uncharacterised protein [Streptococcus agalactiae]
MTRLEIVDSKLRQAKKQKNTSMRSVQTYSLVERKIKFLQLPLLGKGKENPLLQQV